MISGILIILMVWIIGGIIYFDYRKPAINRRRRIIDTILGGPAVWFVAVCMLLKICSAE